jgi:hypothetical protein
LKISSSSCVAIVLPGSDIVMIGIGSSDIETM